MGRFSENVAEKPDHLLRESGEDCSLGGPGQTGSATSEASTTFLQQDILCVPGSYEIPWHDQGP